MEALSRKKPEAKDFFKRNYAALEHDLLALDDEMKSIVAKNPLSPLVASHPVYDYLSQRYGLNMKSVHWEPDEFPSDAHWSELRAMLKKHPAKWMIWEVKVLMGGNFSIHVLTAALPSTVGSSGGMKTTSSVTSFKNSSQSLSMQVLIHLSVNISVMAATSCSEIGVLIRLSLSAGQTEISEDF